jgi:nucleotide-binding universal stress UspA family protein
MAADAPERSEEDRATIVVGVDGSPPSREALGWAVRLARRLDADVRVLQVSDDVFAAHEKGYCTLGQAEEWFATARREGLTALRQLVDDLGNGTEGVEVELDVLPGQPAEVLVEASRDAELLVVGPRGMGRLRLLIGSVTLACLQQAHCPVVVVGDGESGR